MLQCVICGEPDDLRRACNSPKEEHYACAECIEEYEVAMMKSYGEKRKFFTMEYAQEFSGPSDQDIYPKATYARAKCPCEGCKYSFYPVRDGPTRLHLTELSTDMPECCRFQVCPQSSTHIYGAKNKLNMFNICAGVNWIEANLKIYEIANFKEGRLNGKYLIVHLYKKVSLKKIDGNTVLMEEEYKKYLPMVMVSVITFENGLIKSLDEYVSHKYWGITAYFGEVRLFTKEPTPDQIYQDLLGEEGAKDRYHLIRIKSVQYEMNMISHMKTYYMVYDSTRLGKDLDSPPPYYSILSEVQENTLYITPAILKQMRIIVDGSRIYTIRPLILNPEIHYLKRVKSLYRINKKWNDDISEKKAYLIYRIETDYKVISQKKTQHHYMWNTSYYESGQIYSRIGYSFINSGYTEQDGPEVFYYENGQVKRQVEYRNGKREGYLFEYARDGTLTQYAYYQKGKKVAFYP